MFPRRRRRPAAWSAGSVSSTSSRSSAPTTCASCWRWSGPVSSPAPRGRARRTARRGAGCLERGGGQRHPGGRQVPGGDPPPGCVHSEGLDQKTLSQATVEEVADPASRAGPGADGAAAPRAAGLPGGEVEGGGRRGVAGRHPGGEHPPQGPAPPRPRHPPPHGAQGRVHRPDAERRASSRSRRRWRRSSSHPPPTTPRSTRTSTGRFGSGRGSPPASRWRASPLRSSSRSRRRAPTTTSSSRGRRGSRAPPVPGRRRSLPKWQTTPTASAAWDSCVGNAVGCKAAAEDAKSSVQAKQIRRHLRRGGGHRRGEHRDMAVALRKGPQPVRRRRRRGRGRTATGPPRSPSRAASEASNRAG